jgi:hypothetical protein
MSSGGALTRKARRIPPEKEDRLRHACVARIGWNCCPDPADPRDLVGALALGESVGTKPAIGQPLRFRSSGMIPVSRKSLRRLRGQVLNNIHAASPTARQLRAPGGGKSREDERRHKTTPRRQLRNI